MIERTDRPDQRCYDEVMNDPQSAASASPGDVHLAPRVDVPGSLLDFRFDRSSGPGGQNVNRRATKATLRVDLDELASYLPDHARDRLVQLAGHHLTESGLIFQADESRSQRANRQACIDRLSHLVTRALQRPRKRKPTRPTAGSRRRRLEAKKRRGQIKQLRKPPPTP
jgi:ribosome-associated protein